MKPLYLPNDNTCEKCERFFCMWAWDEDKSLSEFQKTFPFGQKLNFKLTAKKSCTRQFSNNSFVANFNLSIYPTS